MLGRRVLRRSVGLLVDAVGVGRRLLVLLLRGCRLGLLLLLRLVLRLVDKRPQIKVHLSPMFEYDSTF